MTTLSKLIGRKITPEAKDRNTPTVLTLSAPILPNIEKLHTQYEADVFNFLLADRERLTAEQVAIAPSDLVALGSIEAVSGTPGEWRIVERYIETK